MAEYTITDIEYWRETESSLHLRTTYDYNNQKTIQEFPKILGDWRSRDFRYYDEVYTKLNADILLSREYTKSSGELIWLDIINSRVGESFHKQKICAQGAGWNIENESIAEFRITDFPNSFTKLYANRLDISKGNKKQVMVYWFMFKKFGISDAVSMIRLSSPVAYNETATYDTIKGFVESELYNAMYGRNEIENITMAGYIIEKYGRTGIIALILSVSVPIGLVYVGLRRKN